MTVWYSLQPNMVKLLGKTSATVAQVRGNYVLCRTGDSNYPWPDWKALVRDWEGCHHIYFPNEIQGSQVVYQGQPQKEKSKDLQLELGGSMDIDEDDVPDLNKFIRIPHTIELRFNIVYDITSGAPVSMQTLSQDAFNAWITDKPQPMNPNQIRIVLESCNIETEWAKMYQNLDGVGVKIPSELKCIRRHGGNGRIWQYKYHNADDEESWADITLEEVLRYI